MNTSTAHSVFTPAPRWPRSPDPSLPEGLAAIEGLDLGLALRYSGGQMTVLSRVVRRFVATYRQGLPVLLDSVGDEHEVVLRWRTACHSLRGALAMIGATALMDRLNDFERELNALAPMAALRPAARQVHESLVAVVGQIAAELEQRPNAQA